MCGAVPCDARHAAAARIATGPLLPAIGRSAYALVMQTGPGLVDYALQRRALLARLSAGQVSVAEVCDASTYLLRAAKFHGIPTDTTCPVCRKEPLTHVYWVFGDALGPIANSARSLKEIDDLAARFSQFTVHEVEVCRTCCWNYLIASFVRGTSDEHQSHRPRRAAR